MKFNEYKAAIENYIVDDISENWNNLDDIRINYGHSGWLLDHYRDDFSNKGILQRLNVDIGTEIGPVLVSNEAKELVRNWTDMTWDRIMDSSAVEIDNIMSFFMFKWIDSDKLVSRAFK